MPVSAFAGAGFRRSRVNEFGPVNDISPVNVGKKGPLVAGLPARTHAVPMLRRLDY